MKLVRALLVFGLACFKLEAQECLRTSRDDGTVPPFKDDKNAPTLPARSQVITPTFWFGCCGKVQQWRTFVSEKDGIYNLTFQIWRPTTANISGCYTLVDENKFSDVIPDKRAINIEVPAQDRIQFQENDVIGFDITRIDGNGGIQLEIDNNDYSNDVIWYNTFSVDNPNSEFLKSYPYCTGDGELLPTSTTAAPMFSVMLDTTCCGNSQPLQSTTSSLCLISSSQVQMTRLGVQTITPTTTRIFDRMTETTSSSFSPAAMADVNTTAEILDSASQNRPNSSRVVAGVIAVLVVMIFTVIVVVTAVLVMYGIYGKRKSGVGNSGCKNLELIGHIYQVVDDKHVPGPQENSISKSRDCISSDGTYSLYSPPSVPSSTSDYLTTNDKENGYNVIKIDLSTNNETFDAGTDNEYSYVDSTTVTKNVNPSLLEISGLAVPNKEQRQAKSFSEDGQYRQLNFFETEPLYWVPANSTEEVYDQLSSRKYREIPRKQVTILEDLGSGQFGSVSKGLWSMTGNSLLMAVKRLKPNAPSTARVKLLQEAAIMGQFHHTNIIQLYGLITIGEPLTMCIEFMKNGDLETYVKAFNVKRDSPPNNHKDIKYFFIQAATDIASGMDYLSKKAFVHRDLATRNILLSDTMTCKIGDFGMARDLVDDTYYSASERKAIPVRWTAPEAIFHNKYSVDSDVWSFGMVLFEIWSVGKMPFPLTENHQVPDLIKIGYCQAPPPGCPRAVYQLMVDCWNPLHDKRPKFSEICTFLQRPMNKLLYWSPLESQSPQANELGGNIEEAQELYKDLQTKYRSSDKGKQTTYF